MSCTEFNTFMSEAEVAILDIATVCEKQDYYRQMLLDLRDKPLDTRMFCQYEKFLLQTINNYEDIIKENEVLKDGMESLKNSNAEMKENIERLCILQTGETSAEIDNHRKDQTYTEIKAVTACLQMLDHSKVLILSGREGSGKSKNSLEILRRIKEKHPETDVIKLKRLTQFSDIIKEDALTVVLFEDVFGRITKQFCENTDQPILDSLHSYINLGNIKTNEISIDKIKVSIIDKPDVSCRLSADNKCLVINSWDVEDMIRSDPYQGFPECCRLFTRNKNITKLGVTYFRYPLKSLLKEVENMRIEGKTNDVMGLKYVILLNILLNKARSEGSSRKESYYRLMLSINENDIDVQAHQKLFNECYDKNIGLKLHDIIYLCEELTCRYLTRKRKHDIFSTSGIPRQCFHFLLYKNITICVDPGISLTNALEFKYIDIIKWLLKHTDHSLIDFRNLIRYKGDGVALNSVECVQFILENVKHDMIDMTKLLMNMCCSSNNKAKHAITWMVDNVDNSLIDYDICISEILRLSNLEMFIDSILYIVKKKATYV
ncbi:unnamed protein product [Mytilus edulis]|uniref:Novel STAND NTPase 3 domain-containing protein n=1 Tax=Mytilus edulis TaxID=6550 RepID=A0A8S3Q4G8_MYTED|nr:unnamed protein product [Mytilus edulis]